MTKEQIVEINLTDDLKRVRFALPGAQVTESHDGDIVSGCELEPDAADELGLELIRWALLARGIKKQR